MPETGMDRIDYIKNKFGSIENAKPMYDNMIMQGEQENLEIKLDKIKRTPNTVKSHILIDAAKEEKKENEVIFELFKNYFTMGKDIGDEKILLTIAKKHSLNESLIKDAFQLDQNKKKINQMDLIAKQMGISGVPFYVFNDHVSISGAQSVSTLKQAIQKSVNG